MIEFRIHAEDLDIMPEIIGQIDEVAAAVPEEFRKGVDSDSPKGRIYRRGSITGRLTKSGIAAGFRQTSKSRMAVGSRFHRASAEGQFPGKDSGELYRRIRVTGKGTLRQRVVFDAPHAGPVEEIRPFAEKTADLVVQRFI